MREKLNDNPRAQLAIVGVLLLLAGVFFMSTMGKGSAEEGKEEESSAPAAAVAVPIEGSPTSLPAVSSGVGAPPPLPRSVTAAFAADDTVVLLFVRPGGIDDRMVAAALLRLHSFPGVVTFVVPASRIARYAEIAQGANVNRVPALVVLRPKRLDAAVSTASVHYGYQSPESVEQAVIDAGYKGRTVPYHP
ncbi:MAG TPA: hypothetical protein VIE64_05770 [Solirubrobacterales bacterium]|jgi:hypothetical protein